MPAVRSAGILLWRAARDGYEVLIAHPGGPFWANKDQGAWSVPKGEVDGDEDLLEAAYREFAEELGQEAPRTDPRPLGEIVQKNRKVVSAWAVEGDLDPDTVQSNTFELQWPPSSGRMIEVPEIDRVAWVGLETAREKLNPAQVEFIDRLALLLES